MSGNCKDCRHWAFHQDMRGKEWHECDAVDWRTRHDNTKMETCAG